MLRKNYILSLLAEISRNKSIKKIVKEYISAASIQLPVAAKTLEKRLLGEEVMLIFPVDDNLYCLISGKLEKVKSNADSMIKQASEFGKGDHQFVFLYTFYLDTLHSNQTSKFYLEKGNLFWNVLRAKNNKLLMDCWPTGVYYNNKIYLIQENLEKKVKTITT